MYSSANTGNCAHSDSRAQRHASRPRTLPTLARRAAKTAFRLVMTLTLLSGILLSGTVTAWSVVKPGTGGLNGPVKLARGVVGTAYSVGIDCYFRGCRVQGNLPPGLREFRFGTSFSIQGTPTTSGTYEFRIDGDRYEIIVWRAALSVQPSALPNGQPGDAYSQSLSASGAAGPFSFTVSDGNLPTGLTLSTSGSLGGNLPASGSFSFTVRASDSYGNTGTAQYTIAVGAPTISISPGAMPPVTGGVAYSQTFTASGGAGPYTFQIAKGKLPSGMTLNPTGALSGTATEGGQFDIVIKATDTNHLTATANYTITVSGQQPTVPGKTVSVPAGRTAIVDLVAGATGGPFTGIEFASVPPPEAGALDLLGGPADYRLAFRPALASAGQTVTVSYRLLNTWGASQPGEIRFDVTASIGPDPADNPFEDPEVAGLVRAQMASAQRFAETQTTNFAARLEQLRDRRGHSFNVAIGGRQMPMPYAEGTPPDHAAQAVAQLGGSKKGEELPADEASGDQGSAPSFWSNGFVNFGSNGSSDASFKHTLIGISAGADYSFSPRFVGGFGIGYGRDASDVGTNGTGNRAQAISAAVYGSYAATETLFIDGLLGWNVLDMDSRRFVTDTGGFATGSRGGSQAFGMLTVAYDHRHGGLLLSPYGGIQASWTKLAAFTETGAGAYGLSFGAQDWSAVSGKLGIRANYRFDLDPGWLTPRARLEYVRSFAGGSSGDIGYAGQPAALPHGFQIASSDTDQLGLELGMDLETLDGTSLGISYRGTFGLSAKSEDHGFGLTFATRF